MARTGGHRHGQNQAAEAVMYTRGYVNRGQDGESAINDDQVVRHRKSNSYLSLKVGYYGTKNYDPGTANNGTTPNTAPARVTDQLFSRSA